MYQSTNLQLTYLAAGQAQKHVTVNESLLKLDAIVQLSVVSATTSAEPGSPADGQIYILPAAATGAAWGGMADHALAYYRDGVWEEIAPREGWLAFTRDTDQLLFFTGSHWSNARSATDAAQDSTVLHIAGVETVLGAKTFSADARFNAKVGVGMAPIDMLDVAGNGRFAGVVYPQTDNATSLGYPSNRWSVLYAATGAINTSDAREKTPLRAIPDSVKRAIQRVIDGVGVFQWLPSVATKGEGGARLHIGVTAQAVRDAFLAEGEDPERWALFCADPANEDAGHGKDERADAPVRLGLRHDQLLLLALAAQLNRSGS